MMAQFYPAKELKIIAKPGEFKLLLDGTQINGIMKYELCIGDGKFNVLKLEIDVDGLIEVRM